MFSPHLFGMVDWDYVLRTPMGPVAMEKKTVRGGNQSCRELSRDTPCQIHPKCEFVVAARLLKQPFCRVVFTFFLPLVAHITELQVIGCFTPKFTFGCICGSLYTWRSPLVIPHYVLRLVQLGFFLFL